jgi:hypothetical protein
MSGMQQMEIAGGSAGIVHTYGDNTGGTETVPSGSSTVVIEAYAGGGAGGIASGGATAGAGGSYGKKTLSVSGGQTFVYGVGLHAPGLPLSDGSTGGNGGPSATVDTGTGPAIALHATGGAGGPGFSSSAAGGTCTGGDTNTGGFSVTGGVGTGGAGGGPLGGAGGSPSNQGSPFGGGGGAGQSSAYNSGAGGVGKVTFTYS